MNLEGKRFHDYEILSKLGTGAMGAVYKARQLSLDRLVALKVLPAQLAEDETFIKRFMHEAQIAASLNHPNIVHIYAAGVEEIDGEPVHFFAMEYVEGMTLHERRVIDHQLAPDEALAVCIYVAQALDYAWRKAQMIHRDIKPSNIFLSKTGEVKLGDLGLARHAGDAAASMTQAGFVTGTPHYMSPEQARGEALDFRSDIYSLGCTLYEMLSGHTPYDGSDFASVMVKHITEPPPAILKLAPDCPVPVVMLLNKMLAKHPTARHQSYAELIEQMHSAAEHAVQPATEPQGPPQPHDAESSPQWASLVRKWPIVLAGAAATVVLALGAVWLWKPSGGGERIARRDLPAIQSPAPQGSPTASSSAQPAQEPAGSKSPQTAVIQSPMPASTKDAQQGPSSAQQTVDTTRVNTAAVQTNLPSSSPEPAADAAQSTMSSAPAESVPADGAVAVTPTPSPAVVATVTNPPAGSVAGAAKSDGLAVTFKTSGAGSEIGYYMPQRLTLSSTAPSGIKRPPQDLAAPLYGVLNIGPTEQPTSFLVVLDEPPGKTARLFVDSNANGDLTDDPAAEWQQRSLTSNDGTARKSWYGGANVVARYGAQSLTLHLNMYRFDPSDPRRSSMANVLFYYRDYAYSGELTAGGKTFRALINDERTSGDFRGNSDTAVVNLMVDINGNGRFDRRGERFDVRKPFNIGGTTYELTGMSASGEGGRLVKSTQNVAEIPLTVNLSVGGKVVPFTATTTDGSQVRFPQDYNGKLVLLDFWATWCSPCVRELPNLSSAYAKYHPQGLEVLGISLDRESGRAGLKNFTRDHAMPWPQVCDGKSWQTEIAQTYDVNSIPSAFLVNGATGEILASGGDLRGDALTGTIERSLGVVTAALAAVQKSRQALEMELASLPAEQQLQRIMALLKQLNPEFDGREQHKIEAGVLAELRISTVRIRDLSPLAALKGLRRLSLAPEPAEGKGIISDLSALKGMPLTSLWCHNTSVRDLWPLQGMPLTTLTCGNTYVQDLIPLKGMPLEVLSCDNTPVSSLAPLSGMRLTVLWCDKTQVSDLSPLKTLPLRELKCDFEPERDSGILRGIRTLQRINHKTASVFWRGVMVPLASNPSPGNEATPTLAALREQGAFGFPQKEAVVLCDKEYLKLSAWSNDRYLYLQAVLWKDDDGSVFTSPEGRQSVDRSNFWIAIGSRLERTYNLNLEPERDRFFGYSQRGTSYSDSQHEARGGIRFVGSGGAKQVRVDSCLIPLREINRRKGDTLKIFFEARSPKPAFRVNAKGVFDRYYDGYMDPAIADYLEITLGGGTAGLTVSKVPDDRRNRSRR